MANSSDDYVDHLRKTKVIPVTVRRDEYELLQLMAMAEDCKITDLLREMIRSNKHLPFEAYRRNKL